MAEKKNKSTVERIYDLAKPLADELNLDIWDIRFEKEGSDWFLRVFIDKEGGIFIDDCEALSRPLNKLLDELNPISQSYVFEVCSSGLGRELKKLSHFEKYIDKSVRVRFIRAADGVKELTGILKDCDKEKISILCSDEELRVIMLSDCAFVKANDDQDIFK